MKKNALVSYLDDIRSSTQGESYSSLLRYFIPEFINVFVLYIALNLLDSYYISCLKDCQVYTTLGLTSLLFHFLTKVAEGFSVGLVILCGQYNGIKKYNKVGESFIDAFWLICIIGLLVALSVYGSAYLIYGFYNTPASALHVAVPFLRLKSCGIFLLFVYLACVGFLRSIKNTYTPMVISLIGAGVFVVSDWILIFGKCGAPALGLLGSSCAMVIQYSVMSSLALFYIFYSPSNEHFNIRPFARLRFSHIYNLIKLSYPVIIDKAILALCVMWLVRLMSTVVTRNYSEMLSVVQSSFVTIKDIERCAILPGVALAQVITFLVSNDYKKKNWDIITINIKKVVFLAVVIVSVLLAFVCLFSYNIIGLFDKTRVFTSFAVTAIPVISVLVLFDLIQLVLSAALRGAACVKVVMYIRLAACLGFFIPVSYILTFLPIKNALVHFILLYASLYGAHAIMCYIYISYLQSGAWKAKEVQESSKELEN